MFWKFHFSSFFFCFEVSCLRICRVNFPALSSPLKSRFGFHTVYLSSFSSLPSFSDSNDSANDTSSGEEESASTRLASQGYITGQLFLNMHHLHRLVQEFLLSRLLTFYTSKKQFTNDVDFFFPFCVRVSTCHPFFSFSFSNNISCAF